MTRIAEAPRPPTGPDRVDERLAWTALAAIDGLGETLLPRLAAAFGGAARLLDSGRRLDGDRLARRVRRAAKVPLRLEIIDGIREASRDPDAITRRLRQLDAWALTPWDPGYPDALRIIDPPPPVLFGTGDVTVLRAEPLVAVVGTRRPTPHGRVLASQVAAVLSGHGVTVVSGLAIGIDGAAHAATLDADGRTIAVIGGGLAHAGPRAHMGLAERIRRQGGVIVGEHAPDTRPTQGTFPRRNRIISGLARATVVIEAPLGSGALITARHALEQGRSVFAAPGRPGDSATAGCLALLRETPARPLVGIAELLVDLGLGDAAGDGAWTAGPPAGPGGRPLDAGDALRVLGTVERSVAELLLDGPVSADALVVATGQSPAVVAGALTLLQLRGWVVPLGPLQVPAGPLLLRPPFAGAATRRNPS